MTKNKVKSLVAVERTNVELISKIKAYGTWEEDRYIADKHNSFEIWEYNGKLYKIYMDSLEADNTIFGC